MGPKLNESYLFGWSQQLVELGNCPESQYQLTLGTLEADLHISFAVALRQLATGGSTGLFSAALPISGYGIAATGSAGNS